FGIGISSESTLMLMTLLLLAQESTEKPAGEAPSLLSNPLMLVPLFILMYIFIVLRPGKKQEAQRKAMLANLDKDDKILTNGGIIGWVVSCSDDEVTLRIADNVKIKVVKSAIAHNYTKMDAAQAPKTDTPVMDKK